MTKRCAFSLALASQVLMAAMVAPPAAASVEPFDCPIPPEMGTLLAAADKVTITWPAAPVSGPLPPSNIDPQVDGIGLTGPKLSA